jgi:hypothetical protein
MKVIMMSTDSECVPALSIQKNRRGQYLSKQAGIRRAREELTKRDGPPPFPKAICRHTCENDSMAPNGFVCTIHTTWGTYQENMMDRPEEKRKICGKKSASVERTCSYCGRTMKGGVYFRWHGEKCKHKPEEETL